MTKSKGKELERVPAGENDSNYKVTNINLAKSIHITEPMKTEKGPEVIIKSSDLTQGVIIPAKNGGIPETSR